jgi:hypothetical protein
VLGKLLVGLGVVYADRVVGDVELSEGLAALTERLALSCSSTGEGFRKPREHDGTVAEVIRQLMGLAVGSRQTEAGRRITNLQLHGGLPPTGDPGNSGKRGHNQSGRNLERRA